jgi:hypothetical protein
MFKTKQIIDSLKQKFNVSDPVDEERLWNLMREAYYELCREISWEALRDKIQYSYDKDEDGMWLPSDLIDIDCVADSKNIWRKSSNSFADDETSVEEKWVIAEVAKRPLVSGTGINITQGATSFTGASAITSAHIGEYICIGSENAFYKLASATKLETPYLGPTQKSAYFAVRPAGTKRIKLFAAYGVADETAPYIYFWRLPDQLYKEYQMMMLPRADILTLATAEKMYDISGEIESKNSVQKDLYGSKGRYEGKLDKAKAANPEFIPPIRPLNNLGSLAVWGARARYES